jgi:hypothetical protein
MPYQIMYSSQATKPMTVAALEEILADARAGNEERNVTGALVYVDGVFFQIIEGERWSCGISWRISRAIPDITRSRSSTRPKSTRGLSSPGGWPT